MSFISLRESWNNRYKDLDLSAGLRARLHPFYQQNWRAFPYKSLRALMEGLEWPRGYVPTRATSHDNPSDASPGWTDKLNGVTHDDHHWYFAQIERLRKIPVTQDLNANLAQFPSVGIPIEGYNHFGDIDFYEGLIYVALEGHHPDSQLPAVIAIFDQDLRMRGFARLHESQGASGPWCAINPLNGLLYSSVFNDVPDRIRLQVYERSVIANTSNEVVGLELKHLGTMELFGEGGQPLVFGGLQGAAFSKRGHFYLVVDSVEKSADEPSHRGIMGFDMITGRRIVHRLVDYKPWKFFPWPIDEWKHIQELEGITIWEDVDAAGAPGISGQLHLIMLDKDWESDDDLYFKHYEVEVSEDKGKV